MEFDVDKKKAKAFKKEVLLDGVAYYVTSRVKAKHMIQVERLHGTKIGDVEKGLRILAALLYESMGEEGLTFEQMLEYDLTDLEPILTLIA